MAITRRFGATSLGKQSSFRACGYGLCREVRQRIIALSSSHDLLVSADWKGANLFELLMAVPHCSFAVFAATLIWSICASTRRRG
ncbi:HWE histidine kinase domain-containing protein [Mesorhizobium australicum]|uniref:HWE histidine kinase domain-containing protein n=1 Tax=Mesorhizobium australicum TaxID=536018 RepID=UPI0009FBC362